MSEQVCDCERSLLRVPNMKNKFYCENCGKVYELYYQDPITKKKVYMEWVNPGAVSEESE